MSKGRFGVHGGQYIPETLMNEIQKLEGTGKNGRDRARGAGKCRTGRGRRDRARGAGKSRTGRSGRHAGNTGKQ